MKQEKHLLSFPVVLKIPSGESNPLQAALGTFRKCSQLSKAEKDEGLCEMCPGFPLAVAWEVTCEHRAATELPVPLLLPLTSIPVAFWSDELRK